MGVGGGATKWPFLFNFLFSLYAPTAVGLRVAVLGSFRLRFLDLHLFGSALAWVCELIMGFFVHDVYCFFQQNLETTLVVYCT